MDIPRETREQFKALSQEIFGASSKWKKLLDNGHPELITRKTTETVPGENGEPDTTKEVEVPVLFNGVKQYKQKYYTIDTLMEYMLQLKAKRDELLAMIKKQQDEAKAAKEQQNLEKKVQEDLGGSALT